MAEQQLWLKTIKFLIVMIKAIDKFLKPEVWNNLFSYTLTLIAYLSKKISFLIILIIVEILN